MAVALGPGVPRRAGGGLPGVFSYHLEPDQAGLAGQLVEVPFGSRLLPGLIVASPAAPPEVKTRPVGRVLGGAPLVTPTRLALARFVAETYRAPLFESLCLVLPPLFNRQLARALRDGAWSPPRFRPARPQPAPGSPDPPVLLTAAQQQARGQLVAAALAGGHQAFLLYGLTGSGKTLVYLEAVAEVVAAGRQAIVLASEIGLTPELVARFARRFPGRTAVLHSRQSDADHYRAWRAVADGEAQVVIGARSAVFAPAERLGLIVLDEEHEWAYKQDETPRYHARTVALELGRLAGAAVVLSSATPDVETAWRTRQGELTLLRLPGRYSGAGPVGRTALPPVEVVDLRRELREGNRGIFSRALCRELGATLERGEQTILFINRRGTATCVTCRECGYVATCRRCETPLVYHAAGAELVCHRCNRRRPPLEHCARCSGAAIRHLGVGTQRVEQELAALWPGARIARWDRDVGSRRGADAALWQRLRDREVDVLVGTQMVAKGLDFPFVTLVGVMLADVGLYLPDLRAGERAFQLLTQVAGRAGRGERPGRAIVQTYSPEHYAVRFAAAHDYRGFFEHEIAFRREQGYPPFGRLTRFVYSGSNAQRCWREAGRLRRLLQERLETLPGAVGRLIGPAPCYVERVRGRYRWQLVLCGTGFEPLLQDLVLPPGWIVDVDPVSLL